MKLKAVIDFDTIVFRACLVGQGNEFGLDAEFVQDIDYEVIKKEIENKLQEILFTTGATVYSLHLTGSSNFRYDLLPSYKWRRVDSVRPEALDWAKKYVEDTYKNVIKIEGIEADDSAVIDFEKEEEGLLKILCHIDKDLNQSAGKHYNYDTLEIYEVTEEEAEEFLWIQMLEGDTADCYAGCPNVGKVRAEEIVKKFKRTEPVLKTFQRGARKGQSIVEWNDYYDKNSSILDRIKDWYIRGYYTKGGMGHVYNPNHNTTSGFETGIKIDIDWELGKYYISESDMKYIENEIEIMYSVARMLRTEEEIKLPSKKIKLF